MYADLDMSKLKSLLDLCDEGLDVELDTSVTYRDSFQTERVLFSVMTMSGYLNAVHVEEDTYTVAIPNREVRKVLAKMLRSDIDADIRGFRQFSNAVLKGDTGSMTDHLGKILRQGSYMNLKDENCYELVLMTVLYSISSDYRIRTESEEGNGRVDVILEPRRPGAVPMIMELKKSDREADLEKDAAAGLAQIHEKRYYMGMTGTVMLYSISFWGKVPFVKHERVYRG